MAMIDFSPTVTALSRRHDQPPDPESAAGHPEISSIVLEDDSDWSIGLSGAIAAVSFGFIQSDRLR
jgi:hypothetical protein